MSTFITRWFWCWFFILLALACNHNQLDASASAASKCDADDIECHEKAKYSKDENEPTGGEEKNKWQKYTSQIDEAMKVYEPCMSSNCSCHKNQLEMDLAPWKEEGISEELFKETAKLQSRLSHYQIIDNKLYRNDEVMFPFRNTGVEHFLLKLVEQKKLPDTEFLLNTQDWPQTTTWQPKKFPVFSFSKVNSQHNDIMYPAWTFWEGGPAVWPIYPNGLGRWDEQMKIIPKEAKKWPWLNKQDKAFFRGSRTSDERDPLVLLSRSRPDLVDAQYTKNQAWKSEADTLHAKPAEEMKLEEHCKFKYLFNFRGVAASFRYKHLFLCHSLVFHVGDEWLEFFYEALKPWVHYIPVRKNLSDAKELIEFAMANDKVAKDIAKRGRDFIMEHLKMQDIYCYWEELIKQYTQLLKFKPKLNKKYQRIN